MAENDQATSRLADELPAAGRGGRPCARRIGHALEFETWRSLVRRQGLSRKQAVDAMLRFVQAV